MDKRSEIKEILFRNDKNISWLKKRMRTNCDLYYLLSEKSVNFDLEIYEEIMDIFKKEGFITNESERCQKLTTSILQINSIIGSSLTLLNDQVAEFTADDILDFNEKKKALDSIARVRDEIETRLDKIERIITK